MGLLSNLLNGGKNRDSAKAANEYLNQIPGMARQNLNPYINPGEQAGSFVDKILSSYKPSEGYQFKKDELTRELSNNAGAGGFAGTQYDQDQRGKLISSLLSKDQQQYFDNVMGVHNKSYEASSNLNDILTGNLNQQGGLAFRSAEQKNARNAALRDALLKLAGTAGGAFLGGPGGAALGGQLAGLFSGGASGGGTGAPAPDNYISTNAAPYSGAYRNTAPGSAWMGR